ncbi:MAG: hypothetical protein EON55_19390 [Alphaproteobacteria bacterium]|nr:MAG: hypothetical protein EON55_19390 [Alphaproteobacteria bacterium]
MTFAALLNMLVPFERGFPLLPVGPINILFPVFLNLVAFGVLFVARPIRTLRGFRHPPLFWQGMVSLFLIVRAIFSPEFGKAVATAVIYTGTWVAQFALLLTVMAWVGRPAFATSSRTSCSGRSSSRPHPSLEHLWTFV